MEDILILPPESGPICDFCSHPHPYKWYAAPDFEIQEMPPIGGYGWASKGAWAACRTCAGFIEAGHWKALENRAVNSFFKKNPEIDMPREEARDWIRTMHNKFRELYRRTN